MLLFYISFFVLGTIIGSFLNVVINRLKIKKSIKGRSYCVFCKKELNWYELIPILSFVFQKGKCFGCKKKISWQYPLVEFFTGLAFLLIVFYFFNFTVLSIITTCYLLLVTCFLIIVFVYDLKHYLVPDKIIYPAIIITFLYDFYLLIVSNFLIFISYYLLAGLIGGGFFLIIVLISKGKWMGMGDAKIGVLMGLLLGLSHLFVALCLAFLAGAVVSIILLGFKKKGLKSEIPFGPFLTGATFIALLWGDILLNWYLNLFA